MTPMDGPAAAEPALCSPPRPAPALDHEQLTANYAWVRAVAQNLVRDPWGAEDVTQETLLAALAAPPRDVPDEQRLRAWLGRVAFNLSRLGARQGARRRAREVRVARSESLPSVCEELEAAGTISALSSAIAALQEPYKSVVVMRYFDALSTAEIAVRTGTSELAVRKRLWRARNKLRDSLDHDPESGQLLAALLPWFRFARETRSQALAGVAAGVSVCLGVGLWLAADAPERAPHLAVLRLPAERQELLLGAGAPAQEDGLPALESRRTPAPLPARPPRPGAAIEETSAPVEPDEAPERLAAVTVFDLEGAVRSGLEIVAAGGPGVILATSDGLGTFRLPLAGEVVTLEARAPGWATVAPVRLAPGTEALPHALVVAPASDLTARVVDESGCALAQARLELCCEASAFAAVPQPVALDSALLRTIPVDGDGSVAASALARGAGLTLVVRAPGFEPLTRDTRALAAFETFTLRASGPGTVLAGTVRRQSGVPAARARVQLGASSTISDEHGRFRLALRGVLPDSSLQVSDGDKAAEPTTLQHFGARLLAGRDGEVELELGAEHDPVDGKLVGDGAAGWLVAAYKREGGARDALGREQPALQTHSDAHGAFRLALPRGVYDVYALDPAWPRLARSTALDTRSGSWTLALPPAEHRAGFRTLLRGQDGQALAGAEVEVVVRLDGDGERRLAWRTFQSDERGALELPLDPTLELVIGHAALGRLPVELASRLVPPELVLPAPAFVRLADARAAATLRVLDAEGRPLRVRGPLDRPVDDSDPVDAAFTLRDGHSPALEVPAGARWLELDPGVARGGSPQRLTILPRAGAVLEVRP